MILKRPYSRRAGFGIELNDEAITSRQRWP